MWLYHRVMNPNDADGMANSVNPDQTAPLSCFCTVCPDLPVRKLRNITVCILDLELGFVGVYIISSFQALLLSLNSLFALNWDFF